MSDPFHLNVLDCSPPTMPELAIVSEYYVCLDSAYCFEVDTINKGAFDEAEYEYWWETAADENSVWIQRTTATDIVETLCIAALQETDSCWYRVALHYTDRWNNITKYSNPFLLQVVDCTPIELPQIAILPDSWQCQGSEYCFRLDTLNKDTYVKTDYDYWWETSSDGNAPWTQRATGQALCIASLQETDSCWYRVAIHYEDKRNDVTEYSDPVLLDVVDCTQAIPPLLVISSPAHICLDSAYCFTLDTLNKGAFDELDYIYHWEFSRDNINWTEVAVNQAPCWAATTEHCSGYYRVRVTYQAQYWSIDAANEPFFLFTDDCSPPPLPQPVITSEHVVCTDSAYCFEVKIANAAELPDTAVYAYTWEFSRNSRKFGYLADGLNLCLPAVQEPDTGWYRLTVTYVYPEAEGVYISQIFRLDIEDCPPPEVPPKPIIHQYKDTTACDTLLPIVWRGHTWYKDSTATDTLYYSDGTDSLHLHLTLNTIHCTPPEEPEVSDAVVADFDPCLNGKLLFREDFGGNDPNDPEISCAASEGVLYKNACQTPNKIERGAYLRTKRGKGYYNSEWHTRADHTYPNDYSQGYYLMVEGNNSYFYTRTISGGVKNDVLSLSAAIISLHESIFDGEYKCPYLLFEVYNPVTAERIAAYSTQDIVLEESKAELSKWHVVGMNFTLPENYSGFLDLNIYAPIIGHLGNDFGIDDIELRLCQDRISQRVDTTVCDTLMPIVWRGRTWYTDSIATDTLHFAKGGDSAYVQYVLTTKACCPEVQTIRLDSLVCDTLLPFSWQFGDTVLVFSRAESIEFEIPHAKWSNCLEKVYTLHLDTCLCERLYDLIVNKYNWVIVCDNTRFAAFFPERKAVGFAWYKNGELVEGAKEDDYSENAELNGAFQLHITLDDNRIVKSNVLYINALPPTEQRVSCYNHLGMLLFETTEMPDLSALSPGIYILVYQSANSTHTEKVIIR